MTDLTYISFGLDYLSLVFVYAVSEQTAIFVYFRKSNVRRGTLYCGPMNKEI